MLRIVRRCRPSWRWSAVSLLLLAGCASGGGKSRDGLTGRISPAGGTVKPAAASPNPAAVAGVASGTLAPGTSQVASPVQPASAVQERGDTTQRVVPPEDLPSPPAPTGHDESAAAEPRMELVEDSAARAVVAANRMQIGRLDLPGAIDLAFRMQPRLRVYLAGIAQARALSDIAYAPYLPTLSAGVSGGAYNLGVNGEAGGFSFFLPGGSFPVGLNLQSGFALEEVKLQWLICDFGRRAGRLNQAEIGVEIARLQTDRAYQITTNEVTAAYYQVLRRGAAAHREGGGAPRRG